MKKLILFFVWLLLLLLNAAPSFSQGVHIRDIVLVNSGGIAKPINGALVTVCNSLATGIPCSTPVSIFSDSALTAQITQPLPADVNGNYDFWIAPGNYLVTITGPLGPTAGIVSYSKIFTVPCAPNTTCAGVAAGNPGGAFNSVQKNAAGVFGAANAIDDGITFQINEDSSFKGPTPFSDIRRFGGRAVTSVPQTTATINSGSTSATLAAASTFQTGDGAVIPGAGPTLTLSTPSAPTVTPVYMSGVVGMRATTALTGAATYQYQVVAIDTAGGVTPASSVTVTNTGASSLGLQTVTITSASRSLNVVTFTTSANHGLATGAAIYVQFMSDVTFNGVYQVASTPTGTTFTANDGFKTTANGASSSATGGTLEYVTANFISWTSVPNTWIYAVYGRTSGSMVFLGFSRALDTYLEDYGATLMGTPYRPIWLPNTPPVAAQNDYLSTTITAGGGTTSVTLADAASNSVVAATFLFDDGPAFRSMMAFSNGSTPAYIPSTTGSFVINSYSTLAVGNRNVWQAGSLIVNETIRYGSGMVWFGMLGGIGQSLNFDRSYRRPITCNAVPCFYEGAGTGARFDSLAFISPNDQALLVLEDLGFPASKFTNVTFSTGNGGNLADFLSVGYEGRGSTRQTFTELNCQSTVLNGGAGTNWLWSPCIHIRGNLTNTDAGGTINITEYKTNQKSLIGFETTVNLSTGPELYLHDFHTNGGIAPVVTYQNSAGGLQGGYFHISDGEMDTTFVPVMAVLSTLGSSVILENIGGSPPNVISGSSPVNGGVFAFGSMNGFTANTNARSLGAFNDAQANVLGVGSFQYATITAPAAPGFSVNAGGNVPVGTHNYNVQFLDINGNKTPPSPNAVVTTTTGNQTVIINRPAVPLGMQNWIVNRDGAFAAGTGCFAASALTLTWTDTFGFTCGASVSFSSAGISMLSSAGVSTPTFKIVNGGTTSSTNVPNTLTAARTDTVPDGDTSRILVGGLTTTAAASDNVTIQGVTSSSHCSLTATNANAATDSTSTYVSSVTANQLTVTHPANAGRTWNIFCSAN